MIRAPPRSTRTDTRFPYTTLFRSIIIAPVRTAAWGIDHRRQKRSSQPGRSAPLRSASRPGWHQKRRSTNYMPGPVIAGSPIFADTLRRMGERGDIIRTMQRAYAAKGQAPAIADQVIYDPEVSDARSLVGRVLERGLSEEYADRHHLIVEATDGRSHYVEIGKGEKIGNANV